MFYAAWQGEGQAVVRSTALQSLGFCLPLC